MASGSEAVACGWQHNRDAKECSWAHQKIPRVDAITIPDSNGWVRHSGAARSMVMSSARQTEVVGLGFRSRLSLDFAEPSSGGPPTKHSCLPEEVLAVSPFHCGRNKYLPPLTNPLCP